MLRKWEKKENLSVCAMAKSFQGKSGKHREKIEKQEAMNKNELSENAPSPTSTLDKEKVPNKPWSNVLADESKRKTQKMTSGEMEISCAVIGLERGAPKWPWSNVLADESKGKTQKMTSGEMERSCAGESVKHRGKIWLLKTKNCNELSETAIPLKAFVQADELIIGKGSIGARVYVGVMKDGREVAVKRMARHVCEDIAENELEILKRIQQTGSPYIVRYWDFHFDEVFMYVVLDLCEETLKQLIQTCSAEYLQQHRVRMIKEILLGLNFLHSKGILHRDLKPSNILVDVDGCLKLADFGISRVLNEDETTVDTAPRGTQGWMPPEVIEEIDNEGGIGRYKKKSDVHVAGMVAFYILTKGEHPFGPRLQRMSNISEGKPVFLHKVLEPNFRQFISLLISHDIDERPYTGQALRDWLS